jgi:hypothetical protein
MTHDDVVHAIQERAKKRGILTHYCGPAKLCKGDRGAPDLVLAGMFGAAWIEVKTPGDQLDPGQTTWKYALLAAGQEHYVIRPPDLEDGRVDGLLDRLAGLEVTRRAGYITTTA